MKKIILFYITFLFISYSAYSMNLNNYELNFGRLGKQLDAKAKELKEQEYFFEKYGKKVSDPFFNFDNWIKELKEFFKFSEQEFQELDIELGKYAEKLSEDLYQLNLRVRRDENLSVEDYPEYFKKLYYFVEQKTLNLPEFEDKVFLAKLPKNYFTIVLLNYYFFTKHNLWFRNIDAGLTDYFEYLFTKIRDKGLISISFFGLEINFLELRLFLKLVKDSLNKADQIKVLVLDRKNLDTLPEDIKNFKNLEILNLNNNNFSCLPDIFDNLTKLRKLDLHGNLNLKTLPKTLLDRIKTGEVHVNLEHTPLAAVGEYRFNFEDVTADPEEFRD